MHLSDLIGRKSVILRDKGCSRQPGTIALEEVQPRLISWTMSRCNISSIQVFLWDFTGISIRTTVSMNGIVYAILWSPSGVCWTPEQKGFSYNKRTMDRAMEPF